MHRLHRTFSIALAVAVGAVAWGAAPQAAAQEASALEEIIVTARKRQEALADIPIAITAFSSEDLIRGGFTSLEDLSFQTAGMHFHKQGGQIPGRFSSRVRFRGMNTNANPPSQQVGTVFPGWRLCIGWCYQHRFFQYRARRNHQGGRSRPRLAGPPSPGRSTT